MPEPAVLSADQLAELASIDSPTVSNAVDTFGVRDATEGFASLDLRCIYPDLPPVVGYAVTCTDDSSTSRKGKGNGYTALYEAIEASPKPVIVVFKSPIDAKRSLHMGEVMASIVAGLGAVAVVTDGGVRDIAGVRSTTPGFQMFAAGAVVAGGAPSLIDVGITVGICGLTISQGDLLHGDANGLLTIPHSVAPKVAEVARRIQKDERAHIEQAQRPDFSVADLQSGQ
jgi:4-hydroxy-4-methyl-2-oxoglutarate aldolase